MVASFAHARGGARCIAATAVVHRHAAAQGDGTMSLVVSTAAGCWNSSGPPPPHASSSLEGDVVRPVGTALLLVPRVGSGAAVSSPPFAIGDPPLWQDSCGLPLWLTAGRRWRGVARICHFNCRERWSGSGRSVRGVGSARGGRWSKSGRSVSGLGSAQGGRWSKSGRSVSGLGSPSLRSRRTDIPFLQDEPSF